MPDAADRSAIASLIGAGILLVGLFMVTPGLVLAAVGAAILWASLR